MLHDGPPRLAWPGLAWVGSGSCYCCVLPRSCSWCQISPLLLSWRGELGGLLEAVRLEERLPPIGLSVVPVLLLEV